MALALRKALFSMKAPTLTTVLIITIISLALLIPGVTQPMLTLTGTIDKKEMTDTGIDIIVDSIVEKVDEEK